MASYDLFKVLRQKASSNEKNENVKMTLDDLSRIKTLSPGRQVAKRFIRNRLAVFGTVLLLVMFIFSFLGPVFYAYGQKQIFYKHGIQNVNYALARENTAFTGYVLNDTISVNRNAVSSVNTEIKKIIAQDQPTSFFLGDDGAFYEIQKISDHVFLFGKHEATRIGTLGKAEIALGTFDSISGKTTGKLSESSEDFLAAVKKSSKGKGGNFDFDGISCRTEKAKGKTFSVYSTVDGFNYDADALGDEFETSAQQAGPSECFSSNEKTYCSAMQGELRVIYEITEIVPISVYTNYVLNVIDKNNPITEAFRIEALLSSNASHFSFDNIAYSVVTEDDELVIKNESGDDFADFSTFAIRRYDGTDSIEYRLKKKIASVVAEMSESNSRTMDFSFELPRQSSIGEYEYADDGSLLYDETTLHITQKDTGEYLINCDQIIYMIDMYASPSPTHILGTDGDGFDVLSRIMYGGRISLLVGFVVVILESFLGILMGGLAGYYGGWVDNIVMRLVDIFYCLPSLPIMIILGALMDALRMNTYVRLIIMMAALGLMGWASVARLVRGQILSLREQEFMVAAEATGIHVRTRIFRHLIPNVMPQLIVSATMGIGNTILTESTLSFLGLGVKHPLATWGTIINSVSSASDLAHYTFIWIPVGLLICLTVIAFNFVGDGLRDAYDPKSKR